MRWALISTAFLMFTVPAAGQEVKPAAEASAPSQVDDEARKIMEKADEAVKKVFYVKYDALFQGTGFMVNNAPTVKGTAIQRGKTTQGYGQYRFHIAEAQMPWSEEKETFVSGYDGRTYYVLETTAKTAHLASSKEKLGRLGRLGDAIGLQYFAHPNPYKDDLSAPVLRLRGEATVGDQECWEIAVTYADPNKGKGVWYISKKDYLPRRMDRLVVHPDTGEVGSMQWIFTNLTTQPPQDNDVAYQLPPGYTEVKVGD